MDLWQDDLECKVSEMSSAKRDEILLLVDSGYPRRAISKQTATAVDVIEYLVANRMRESSVSADDDSDPDMAEQEFAATPSGHDVGAGIPKSADKRSKSRRSITVPTPQQEAAILQLFAEGVGRDEIVRCVKIGKNTVANILLLHGKSFAQRNPRAKVREPLRATAEQRRAIRALHENGCAGVRIAQQLGIGERIVLREIHVARRTERITDNIDGTEKMGGLPVADAAPFSNNDFESVAGADQRKQGTASQQHTPENQQPDTSVNVSSTLSDELLSDSSGSAAVRIFHDALMNFNSSSDCASAKTEEKPHSGDLENPASTSARHIEPMTSEQNECCDLLGASSEVKAENSCTNLDEKLSCVSVTGIEPSGRQYRCDLCRFHTHFESIFISHLLGTKHALLASKGVIVRCDTCPFRTRQPSKMVRHAVTHQFHCLPDQEDIYSIVSAS